MADHDAELDVIVTMLTDAGLLETYTDDDGKPALRLTQRGAQVGRAMAMAGEDADALALLNALLDAQTREEVRPSRDGPLHVLPVGVSAA